MENLKELNENEYVSINTFDAEDNKPFKFAVCVEVIDLDSACGKQGYLITASAAKLPKYLTAKQRKDVADCMGMSTKEITVNDVCSYGLYAPLDNYVVPTQDEVNSKLAEIDKQVIAYGMLCGFYFDKRVNQIGNTGWDFLNGNIG